MQDQAMEGGDALTMLATFQKCREDLRRFLRRHLKDDADVEDCVQDTFLRVWRRAIQGGLREDMRGYIFTAAINIARDRHRRSAVRRQIGFDDVAAEAATLRTTEREADFGWREGVHLVEAELEKLKPATRRVFLMHHVEQLTMPEIAEALGISTRTVEREMARALERLKSALGPVIADLKVDS